jgi:hypothetical protein
MRSGVNMRFPLGLIIYQLVFDFLAYRGSLIFKVQAVHFHLVVLPALIILP